MNFLRQVLRREKRLLPMAEVRWVQVPKLGEFNCDDLYKRAITDELTRIYLPDPKGKNQRRPIGRTYLFNVSSEPDSTRASHHEACLNLTL